jgi:hypothetical protein
MTARPRISTQATPPEADFHVATLHELPAVMPELFA